MFSKNAFFRAGAEITKTSIDFGTNVPSLVCASFGVFWLSLGPLAYVYTKDADLFHAGVATAILSGPASICFAAAREIFLDRRFHQSSWTIDIEAPIYNGDKSKSNRASNESFYENVLERNQRDTQNYANSAAQQGISLIFLSQI